MIPHQNSPADVLYPHLNCCPPDGLDFLAAMDMDSFSTLLFSEGSNLFEDALPSWSDNLYEFDDCELLPDPKKVVLKNCRLSGCNAACRKTHDTNIDLFESSFDETLGDFQAIFGQYDDEECVNSVATDSVNVQPYTPDSDHCYSQPMHLQIIAPENIKKEVQSSVESESPSDSSDDEVDVVTVPEEHVKPTVPRHVEQQRRITRPRRYVRKQTGRNASRNRKLVSTVKAAACALKRTRYEPRQCVKRRKLNSVETSPSSSLPSSCVSSRSNSDAEEFEKRNVHNDLERKRREAQRSALQLLRISIPTLHDKPKAPKVLILKTATNIVKQLESELRSQQEIKRKEEQRRNQLLAKFNRLKNEHLMMVNSFV